jgi:hypothetical protein
MDGAQTVPVRSGWQRRTLKIRRLPSSSDTLRTETVRAPDKRLHLDTVLGKGQAGRAALRCWRLRRQRRTARPACPGEGGFPAQSEI